MLTEAEIGQRVRELRESLNLSQAAFAQLVQSHGLAWRQPTVSRIEEGERPVRLAEAVILAEQLGLAIIDGASYKAGVRASIQAVTALLDGDGGQPRLDKHGLDQET